MMMSSIEQQIVEINGHTLDAIAFRQALRVWGKDHFRPLPWRPTDNPYYLLMAEVMLHRTQAPQVVPVYKQFIQLYPDIPTLAGATRADLYGVLGSLGLLWRIDLIHTMGDVLMSRFAGQVPSEKADLLTLPGVSDYIASAVRCFAWNLPEPLIDTNTVRVVGRLFGLNIKDSSRRNPQFRRLIGALVDPEYPREYNYALLDLADRVCMKKQQPDCKNCPVRAHCTYGKRPPGIAGEC
jgi:A/G-specific adenine glycosylase